MGLSKKHLNTNSEPVNFSIEALTEGLKGKLPFVTFACLLGSAARSGVVKPHSDLDLAFYLSEKPSLSFYSAVEDVCGEYAPGVRCDTGILNKAEPVYRFEAIKGRLLFTRDMETWLRFYSLTCREYETQMFHYEKQLRYRLEVKREKE